LIASPVVLFAESLQLSPEFAFLGVKLLALGCQGVSKCGVTCDVE